MSGSYNRAKVRLATGELDWDEATKDFVVVAVTDAYTFDPDHQTLADVNANELTGTGTRAPIANRSVVENLTDDRAELHGDDSTLLEIDTTEDIGYLVVAEDIGAADSDKFLVGWLSSDGAGAAFGLPTNGADVLIAYPSGRVTRIE